MRDLTARDPESVRQLAPIDAKSLPGGANPSVRRRLERSDIDASEFSIELSPPERLCLFWTYHS